MPLPSILSVQGLSRASARRPGTTLGLWLLAVLASALLFAAYGRDAFTTTVERFDDSESTRAEALLRARFPESARPPLPNETIVIRSGTLTVDDAAFRSHVEALSGRLLGLGGEVLAWGASYYLTGDESLVSRDRRTTLIPLAVREPLRNIDLVHRAVRGDREDPRFDVYAVGRASIGRDYKALAEEDLKAELRVGLPAALAVLLAVFATVVAALVPVVVGLASIAVALAAIALLGQALQAYFLATNMIVMMGLAVGIDYSLFILSRYREERGRGRDKLGAISAAGETAGRAILLSGATVVLSLLGLLLVPTNVFRSLAAGAIVVVLAAMLASFTLLPALVSLLGERLETLRLPLPRGGAPGRGWDRVTRAVTRRPLASLAIAILLLVGAALPALQMKTGFAGIATLPERLASARGFRILQDEFDVGTVSSARIVIDGRPGEAPVQAAMARLRAALAADPAFFAAAARLQVNESGDLGVLVVPMDGDAESRGAQDGIARLRAEHVPRAFSGAPARALVGGSAAGYVDFFSLTDAYTPLVFAFVLGLSFVLLAAAFRSLAVPLTAIVVNLLSVGAAYGLLVLVFQHGAGAALFGFRRVDLIEAWIPLFLFTLLFGLSMDYQVFLLSRIRERYEQTRRNADAVAFGLRTTGGVITGAALIMVAIFAGFASGELVMFQQVGFGLAVAILLDATVVRAILVPAAMTLLGEGNWWLPRR